MGNGRREALGVNCLASTRVLSVNKCECECAMDMGMGHEQGHGCEQRERGGRLQ